MKQSKRKIGFDNLPTQVQKGFEEGYETILRLGCTYKREDYMGGIEWKRKQ